MQCDPQPSNEMSATLTSDRIPHILRLVGPALLLPWPAGSKGGKRKWKHLQISDMGEPSHLAKLARAGNIGIALGKVSNGLVTIDLDQDSYVETFLGANPLLANTLRTCGSRGCNIWVRCSDGYPSSQKLKNVSGDEIGELRADGNQTIIAGTHPEGMPYRFVVEKPVIPISYDAIIWPKSILAPAATESQRVRRVREKEVVSVSVGCLQIQAFFSDVGLIAQVAPTDYHQNNDSLFKLARSVKSYEHAVERPATNAELEFVFDRWCPLACRFWRHTRDDYYAEFLEAYSYARIGLDENPVEVAVSRAKAAPLPQVQGFTDERIRLLVAICREMQILTGDSPFFLPTRKLGKVLGAHWTEVGRWLRILEKPLQVIHLAPGEVRKRGGNRSPRYHYGPPQLAEGMVIAEPLALSDSCITAQEAA
jgi:Bifunctional DNA primase/polymerase, N-terminal